MINVRVIKISSIIKILFIIILIVIIVKCVSFMSNEYIIGFDRISRISKENLINYMNYSLPEYLKNNTDVKKIDLKFSADNLLKFELDMLNNIIDKSNLEINKDNLTFEDIEELLPDDSVKTEIIETNIEEKFNLVRNNVKINNKSGLELTEEIITPDFEPVNVNDILIYHTHTCESYTPTEKYNYEHNGNYRTQDLNFTVARVGDELEKYLKKFGFNVIHDKTYHDYPAYSGSYDNSYGTVSNILEKNKGIEIIFDLHRDALGSDNTYAPIVKIGNEYVSQLMFVIGTNGGGLEHNNWQNNLKTAIKIQQKANEMYPGLFKPIIVRDSRYNQNLGNSASIIEVGATGNTLEQSINSMKYLSMVLNELWGN